MLLAVYSYINAFTDIMHCRFLNNSWPFSNPFQDLAEQNQFAGQIYCTFPMGKPMIDYKNVPTTNEWLTNF